MSTIVDVPHRQPPKFHVTHSTNIGTEYFKHGIYSPFLMQFFHNSNVFGSCIIQILYTVVLKLKK